jgi:hypothetical protein
MSHTPGWKPGRWSAICDVCGFKFHSDAMRKRWDGLMVCHKDYETRHPQEFIRPVPEKITPEWTRPEPADTFLSVCYLWEDSAYADLAAADCATADTTTYTYTFLSELKEG